MIWRIRSRKVFSRFQTDGRRVRNGPIRMTFVGFDTEHPQLALAFGRRFGNAVERNRGRRRVRAAFASAWDDHHGLRATGLDGAYLVSGSRRVLDAPFDSLVSSLGTCLAELAELGRTDRSSNTRAIGGDERPRDEARR